MPIVSAPDGCELYYETGGDGEDTILFIPGLGGDGRFWNGVRAALPSGLSHIVVDHRGAGRCGRPGGRYTIDLITSDVITILDHLCARRVHVVGHSTGGAVAQSLGIDHADRVASLVISASWERADPRFRLLFGARRMMIDAGLFESYQALTQVFGFDPAYLEQEAERLEEDRRLASDKLRPASVTSARIAMLIDFDRSEDLARITAPTLVIGSRNDILVPFHHSIALSEAIAGARLAEMAGGHFYPVTHPFQMAGFIASHLKNL
jgi:aminoacrylate hydrolase